MRDANLFKNWNPRIGIFDFSRHYPLIPHMLFSKSLHLGLMDHPTISFSFIWLVHHCRTNSFLFLVVSSLSVASSSFPLSVRPPLPFPFLSVLLFPSFPACLVWQTGRPLVCLVHPSSSPSSSVWSLPFLPSSLLFAPLQCSLVFRSSARFLSSLSSSSCFLLFTFSILLAIIMIGKSSM